MLSLIKNKKELYIIKKINNLYKETLTINKDVNLNEKKIKFLINAIKNKNIQYYIKKNAISIAKNNYMYNFFLSYIDITLNIKSHISYYKAIDTIKKEKNIKCYLEMVKILENKYCLETNLIRFKILKLIFETQYNYTSNHNHENYTIIEILKERNILEDYLSHFFKIKSNKAKKILLKILIDKNKNLLFKLKNLGLNFNTIINNYSIWEILLKNKNWSTYTLIDNDFDLIEEYQINLFPIIIKAIKENKEDILYKKINKLNETEKFIFIHKIDNNGNYIIDYFLFEKMIKEINDFINMGFNFKLVNNLKLNLWISELKKINNKNNTELLEKIEKIFTINLLHNNLEKEI